MRLHSYCVECGSVRSMPPLRGRRMGFFERWLAAMGEALESHPKYSKLVQVHRRLILHALEAVPDFGDPYSMPFETQRSLFLGSILRFRHDLPVEFLEETMPRQAGRVRPAFIDLIASNAQEGGSGRKAKMA